MVIMATLKSTLLLFLPHLARSKKTMKFEKIKKYPFSGF